MFQSRKVVEEIRNRIAQLASRASPEDRKMVTDIIHNAQLGKYESEVEPLTPPVCAILFLEHNPYNRDWVIARTGEYQRRIEQKEWKKNGETIKFFNDGAMADGQHRLSAAALSGETLLFVLVYGLDRDAQPTIDDVMPRYASDQIKLDGIDNAKVKEQIVRKAHKYLVKLGKTDQTLFSKVQVIREIRENDNLLNRSIRLAELSQEGVARPVMRTPPAASVCFLLLGVGDWPESKVRRHLAIFQSGNSVEGEQTPLFVSTQLVIRSREVTGKREKFSEMEELGAVILALKETDRGVKACNRAKFRESIKNRLPSPQYLGKAVRETPPADQ